MYSVSNQLLDLIEEYGLARIREGLLKEAKRIANAGPATPSMDDPLMKSDQLAHLSVLLGRPKFEKEIDTLLELVQMNESSFAKHREALESSRIYTEELALHFNQFAELIEDSRLMRQPFRDQPLPYEAINTILESANTDRKISIQTFDQVPSLARSQCAIMIDAYENLGRSRMHSFRIRKGQFHALISLHEEMEKIFSYIDQVSETLLTANQYLATSLKTRDPIQLQRNIVLDEIDEIKHIFDMVGPDLLTVAASRHCVDTLPSSHHASFESTPCVNMPLLINKGQPNE